MIPSALQLLLMFLLPESPQWLVRKGRMEQAEKWLRSLRPHGYDVASEVIKLLLPQLDVTAFTLPYIYSCMTQRERERESVCVCVCCGNYVVILGDLVLNYCFCSVSRIGSATIT